MTSVATELREKNRDETRRLTTKRRLELGFELADEALAAYMRTSGLDHEEAIRRMERRRQRGRRRSACMDAIIG